MAAETAPRRPTATKEPCQLQREMIRAESMRPVKPPMTVPVT